MSDQGARVVRAVLRENNSYADMDLMGCPDCGAAASIHEVPGPYLDSKPVFYVGCIELRACGRVVSRFPSMERAINAWNRDMAARAALRKLRDDVALHTFVCTKCGRSWRDEPAPSGRVCECGYYAGGWGHEDWVATLDALLREGTR